MTRGVLTVRDAQILDLLRGGAHRDRVVQVGVYRKAWAAEDVDRVTREHLVSGEPVKPAKAVRRRAPANGTEWTPPALNGEPVNVVLSAREVDVLESLLHGLSNRAIAARLTIAEDTVKTHVRRLLAAIGARDRCHVVALVATGAVRVFVTGRAR